jgi:hypothetical protein
MSLPDTKMLYKEVLLLLGLCHPIDSRNLDDFWSVDERPVESGDIWIPATLSSDCQYELNKNRDSSKNCAYAAVVY